ncbi:hypothetical protein [Azoarcus sp. KH32C]|uniref:hypothetical protein n=1 Tax=Azoarcus sp. KH32C TaxID=748247 RepID=UPI0003448F42|nr:hypothetical protein [Azoarcus sp. KH32C]
MGLAEKEQPARIIRTPAPMKPRRPRQPLAAIIATGAGAPLICDTRFTLFMPQWTLGLP